MKEELNKRLPSLKEKGVYHPEPYSTYECDFPEGHFYKEEDIQEHCRDNQRIKEAIDKVKYQEYEESYKAPVHYKINVEDLLKELGLDK